MAHENFKIAPGVTQNDTPVLNEAGISFSSLIRFMYDPKLGGLTQKLGGWTKFYPTAMVAKVRALLAFEDTQSTSHLAVGTENRAAGTTAQLASIQNGGLIDITPTSTTDNVTPAASTTAGSALVVITDATTPGITPFDTVYIPTHISVGGLILFGLYQCDPDGAVLVNSYSIYATDKLGNLLPASSTTTTTAVMQFTTVSGSSTVKVTLPNHGFMQGDEIPILIHTTVGGITLYGHYYVGIVIDANNFNILASQQATASTSAFINSGNARFVYGFGVGALPASVGYGIGGYGAGGYGTGATITPATGTTIGASNWTLDNWGETLIASAISTSTSDPPFQPLYAWDSESGSPIATIIPNAPPVNDGFFVAMPQRQIIAWGTTTDGLMDPLLVRWCDVNNFNDWIGTVINQAGKYRIPRGSRIVSGMQGPQQGFLWTDLGIWSMQYIGQPYIYSFNEVGTGCGLIAKKAAASLGGIIYWMGPTQFHQLSANGVEPLPCPIWDVIFQNLNTSYLDKIRVAVNSRFNEISWFYPSASSTEVDSYVKYNVILQAWDFGSLSRSAWIDQSVLGPPVGADPNSLYLYQHETSNDADGIAMNPSFQTGYFAMSNADVKMFVDQIWPDMKWGLYNGTQNATVLMTLYVKDYPNSKPKVYGPYSLTSTTQFITPRLRGRLVSIKMESNDVGSFWRMGLVRYRVIPDGKF